MKGGNRQPGESGYLISPLSRQGDFLESPIIGKSQGLTFQRTGS